VLLPEHARDFLSRLRDALAEDGVVRIAAANPAHPGEGGAPPEGVALARWSAAELEAELRAAGFGAVEHLESGRSPRPWLQNLEDHPVGEDSPERPATLVVEAALTRAALEGAKGGSTGGGEASPAPARHSRFHQRSTQSGSPLTSEVVSGR